MKWRTKVLVSVYAIFGSLLLASEVSAEQMLFTFAESGRLTSGTSFSVSIYRVTLHPT